METKPAAQHEDFKPRCQWKQEGTKILEVHLPGITRSNRILANIEDFCYASMYSIHCLSSDFYSPVKFHEILSVYLVVC